MKINYVYTGSLEVECNMEAGEGQVATLIHNNLESTIHVSDYESPMSYQKNVTYFATRQHIHAIKNYSTHCVQFGEFECSYTGAFEKSYWTSFGGDLVSYHYSEGACRCKMEKACKEGSPSRSEWSYHLVTFAILVCTLNFLFITRHVLTFLSYNLVLTGTLQ